MKDSTKWYELTPCDAWFFRDGRPMNRGEDARGIKSLFPPTAPTLVGAVRAALARSHGWTGRGDWSTDVKVVLGDGFDDLGKLAFSGPLLAKDGKPVFPCPRHLLLEKDTRIPRGWLAPTQTPVCCDLGTVHLPCPPPRVTGQPTLEEASGDYLTEAGFKKVLKGQIPDKADCLRAEELYTFETRVGIFRNEETRTVGDNALFNPTFVRLKKGVGLLVGVSGLPDDWSVPTLFPMGGESRMAHCHSWKTSPLEGLGVEGEGSLVITLTPYLSPAAKPNGAGPGDAADSLHKEFKGGIRSVATARPMNIPSWDSIHGNPRPQISVLTPGTVWWLESPPPQSGAWRLGDRCHHGYGLAVAALLPKN